MTTDTFMHGPQASLLARLSIIPETGSLHREHAAVGRDFFGCTECQDGCRAYLTNDSIVGP